MKQDLSNQSKEQNLKKGEKKVKAAALLMMAMFFFIKTWLIWIAKMLY